VPVGAQAGQIVYGPFFNRDAGGRLITWASVPFKKLLPLAGLPEEGAGAGQQPAEH